MSANSNPDAIGSGAAAGHWAVAVRGRLADAGAALKGLHASYWYPIYAWWRRMGCEAPEAKRVTESCFDRWISGELPRIDDPGAARFREWLMIRLPAMAAEGVKREGEPDGTPDTAWAEEQFAGEPEGAAEDIFQRRWAITILEFAIETLRRECAAGGREALFHGLFPSLGAAEATEALAAVAETQAMSAGEIHQEVFALRKRYREFLRAIVIDTLASPNAIDAELSALLAIAEAGASRGHLPPSFAGLTPAELYQRGMEAVSMGDGATFEWTAPELGEVARLFPKYEITKMIGRGGMGAVYQGRQVALERPVALKLIPLALSADPVFAQRFTREAEAMAKLQHPNIVAVYDFGRTSEGHLFFAMEYVEGASLHDWIHGSKLEPARALKIAGQMCDALDYAHSRGVIHRDVKPGNVLVDGTGQAKLLDFGLARQAGNVDHWRTSATQVVMGTPDYMAPEQKRAMEVDRRADIYSAGVVLYEMLCGKVPGEKPEPPSKRKGVDARLDAVVARAMHPEPAKRYQSAQEMKAAIEKISGGGEKGTEPRKSKTRAATGAASSPALSAPPREDKTVGRLATLAFFAIVAAGAFYFFRPQIEALLKPPVPAPKVAIATPAAAATPVPEPVAVPMPAPATPAPKVEETPKPMMAAEPEPTVPPGEPWVDWIAEVKKSGSLPPGLADGADGYTVFTEKFFAVLGPVMRDGAVRVTYLHREGRTTQLLLRCINPKSDSDDNTTFDASYRVLTSLGRLDLLHSLRDKQPERMVFLPGVDPDPEAEHTVEFRIVGKKLEVFLNGNSVLQKEDARIASGVPAVFSERGALIKKIEVLKLDNAGTAAATPGAPQSEIERWLAATDAQWQAAFNRDVRVPCDTALEQARKQFLGAIDNAIAAATAAGNNDEAVALRVERQRIDSGKAVPEQDDEAVAPLVKQVRAGWRTQMPKLERDRSVRARTLFVKYDQVLAQAMMVLTQRRQLEAVKLVKAKRDEVAAAWLGTAGMESITAKPGAAAAPSVKTAAIPKGPKLQTRQVAEKLLEQQARLTVASGTARRDRYEVRKIRDLPAERFEIYGVEYQPSDGGIPVTDTALAVVENIPDLRELVIHDGAITDAAFEILREIRGLTRFHADRCSQVKGANFSALAEHPSIENVELADLSVSDDALKAIARSRKIKRLRLVNLPVNDATLQSLLGIPTLETLDLNGSAVQTSAAGWEAIAGARRLNRLVCRLESYDKEITGHIARCKDLTSLSFADRAIGDVEILPIAGLTKLTTLELQGTKVTGDAFKAWPVRMSMQHLKLTDCTGVNDETIKGITAAFPHLESLEITAAAGAFTGAGAPHIARMRNLETLKIFGTAVDDAIAAELGRLDALKHLDLDDAKLTEAGVAALEKLRKLETLRLREPPATEAALKSFAKMRGLREVILGTNAPDALVAKVRGALVGVNVHRQVVR